jgi:hypothetical protein
MRIVSASSTGQTKERHELHTTQLLRNLTDFYPIESDTDLSSTSDDSLQAQLKRQSLEGS